MSLNEVVVESIEEYSRGGAEARRRGERGGKKP